MLSTERPAFESLLAVLCAGFDQPMLAARTEAYWRGLLKMHLVVFERVVDYALGPDGPDTLPNPKQCWKMNRAMRQVHASAQTHTAPVEIDQFESFASTRLLAFLIAQPLGASEESLVDMLIKKRDVVAGYKAEARMDPRWDTFPKLVFVGLKADMGQVLANCFEARYVPMPPEELARQEEVVARTGHTAGFTEGALNRLQQRLV